MSKSRILNEDEAIKTIHEALKSGINYIDTAPWYGQGKSEELLGKALKGVPRKAYYIGTKVGRYELEKDKMFDFSATKTIGSVAKSLKLLGLDYVDVIQIHDIEFAPSLDIVLKETLPTLESVVRQGKAKYIGVTGYPLSVLKEAIVGAPGRFDVVLSYARYTLIDDTLRNYLQFFKEQNIAVICASGHGMGLLTNSGPQSWHPAKSETKEMCRQAAEICKTNNIELGKLAMYYFTQIEGPATFLVGMQTQDLLRVNLDAFVNGLTEKETEILNKLKAEIFTKTTNWEVEVVKNRK